MSKCAVCDVCHWNPPRATSDSALGWLSMICPHPASPAGTSNPIVTICNRLLNSRLRNSSKISRSGGTRAWEHACRKTRHGSNPRLAGHGLLSGDTGH